MQSLKSQKIKINVESGPGATFKISREKTFKVNKASVNYIT